MAVSQAWATPSTETLEALAWPVPRWLSDDLALARTALHKGFVTAEALRACREEQEDSEEPLAVVQILLRRRILSVDQLLEILQEGGADAENEGHPFGSTPSPRVGKFQILRELGRGTMGIVYEAEDSILRRRVALKVLLAGADDLEIERFFQEGRVTARLHHPNIVSVYEMGRVRDESGRSWLHYIALQRIEGGTFAARFARLSLEEKLAILERVAEAAGHAHASGVVHGDLKPSNILLTKQGKPVVTDFGLACWRDGPPGHGLADEILGTPAYMAPEQFEGADRVTPATDVWALGVMLFEVLTGRLPFQEATLTSQRRRVLDSEPEFQQISKERGVAPRLRRICRRALEKDPSRRFRNGSEMAHELRE